nr:hypothetical protein [Tanacetum cinerariifolium]
MLHGIFRFDGYPSVMMGFLRNKDGIRPHISDGLQNYVNFIGHLALLLLEIGFKLRQSSVLRCHKVRHQSFEIRLIIKTLRIVVEGAVREQTVRLKRLRFFDASITKLTTSGLIDGSSCGGIDMVIKDMDLEPKFDAMMRDFLELKSVERTYVLYQPDGVGSQRHHIIPYEELNGVLIALVARFGVVLRVRIGFSFSMKKKKSRRRRKVSGAVASQNLLGFLLRRLRFDAVVSALTPSLVRSNILARFGDDVSKHYEHSSSKDLVQSHSLVRFFSN